LAKHVTDGDYGTHAKPPAFQFDYRIDLREPYHPGFSVSALKIHWGHFGDRFVGIPGPDGKGWAPAAWPADYVTSYEIRYRSTDSDEWTPLHRCGRRPADETGKNVVVERLPTKYQGANADVITTIDGLDLKNVAEIRIQAKGGHWIGLFELEVIGKP
jgi:hypothetical protein